MIRIAQQVSRAIRILRGNRDESARASHLVVEKVALMTYETDFLGQAEREKCSQSTFSERKIMSTKTAFKRVALVAAAALAIGGVSAVSANAAALTTFTGTGITGGAAASASATVGTYLSTTITFTGDTNNATSVTSTGVGSLNVPAIAAGSYNVATTGITSTSFTAFEADTTTAVPGTSAYTLSTTASGHGTPGTLAISAYSATAGTQTITVNSSTGASTLTITWGATPVVTVQYSQVVALAGSTAPAVVTAAVANTTAGSFATTGASTAIVATGDAAATEYASVAVATNASTTHPMMTDALTATLTGPGTLGIGGSPNPSSGGRSLSFTETAGVTYVAVYGDGTAGTATVTITDTTAGISFNPFTVTFVGSPAKATATQGLYVLKAGSTTPGIGAGAATSTTADTATAVAFTSAITANVVDANGNAANGTVKIVSSNTAVLTTAGCSQVTLTPGEYQCDVQGATGALSGQSATVTFEVQDSTGAYTILAAPLTFTIGGAIASEALSTDATSYSALAPVNLTVTAKDSAGNRAFDQDATLVTGLVSTVQLGGTLASPTHLVNGKGSVTGLYAPAVAGDFTISGYDNVDTAGEAVAPVTATSTGGSSDAAANAATDAANEATDAANAATDAANAAADSADAATAAAQDAGDKADAALAAVTALSQQVTTLLSKVAALAATIAKIAKKVKA